MTSDLPRLYLITDRHLAADEQDYLTRIEQALAAGVGMLQLREKDLSAADLFRLGQQLRQLTRRYGARLLINDRVDLALAVDADGVHLTESSLPTAIARHLLGPRKLVAVSTHKIGQINRQADTGADFVTFSPIYPTPSKAAYGPPQGVAILKEACQQAVIPVYALGGITAERIIECRQAGAFGVAVISAILTNTHSSEAAQELLSQL
jgi:thiamine-phosphate pyrophosphorylase